MEFNQDLIINIGIIALAFVAYKYLPRLMAGVPFVDPAVVKGKMDAGEEIIVVDVRTTGEFQGGHIPGAVNLPLGQIHQRIKEVSEDLASVAEVPVYLTCRTENRSPRAARMLKKAGLTNLSVINGGFKRWRKENLPVEG